MITLPDRIKNDLSGNLTSAEYLVAIKTDPVIYISTTKQMFDATEGDVFGGANLITESYNSDFNTDGTDWYGHGGATVTWESDYGANDSGGLMIEPDGNGNEGAMLSTAGYEGEAVDKKFKITASIKGASGELSGFQLAIGSAKSEEFSVTTSFLTYSAIITTVTGSLSILIHHNNNGSSPFYIDNVVVQEVGQTYYEDIDLKLSNIKEKIDLKTKKIQLSSMSLSFSNFPINEVRLSDKLGNGLGKEISVYLKTTSCETLEDCIKVADLKVNRYTHDRNTVKINADDKWLESFYIDLPKTLLEKDKNTFENYHLKPVPILYGHLENAPALPYYEGGEEFSFALDGLKIIPDSSYFGGGGEIQGIKQWNEYDSGGNLRTFDDMEDANVFKVKISDTTLASIPVRPYINTRSAISDTKHNYSQYETFNDYLNIKSLLPEYSDPSENNSTLVGMWCSHISKLINEKKSRFTIFDQDGGDGDGQVYMPDSVDGDTFQYLSSGYTYEDEFGDPFNPLFEYYLAHPIGIYDFEFEPITGIDIFRNEDSDEPVIADVHILGNAYHNYTLNLGESFEQFLMTTIYSPYKWNESAHIAETGQPITDIDLATPSSWNFHSEATGRADFSDNVFTLLEKSRNVFSIKGFASNEEGWTDADNLANYQFNSYFNARFSEDFKNSYKSAYENDYPIIESNNVAMYYTLSSNGISDPNSPMYAPTSQVFLETKWDNVKLRKYWKNKGIFLKDLFVNAKGRVGNELVGATSVNAEIKVWYEGQDVPDDFTSNENKHLTELYKFLTDNKYKTKSINGEIYELMFYSQNLSDENLYIFDIDVNNFYASSNMTTDLDPNSELRPYIIVDGDETDYFHISDEHNLGWMFEITAKIFGNHEEYLNGIFLVYGKKNIVNGVLESITHLYDDSLNQFNIANGGWIGMPITGYTKIFWDENAGVENPRELLEQPEDIIQNLITTEMNVGSVQIPEQTHSKFAFSINEQENSKDIIENICRQSELFFRYSPRDGQAIIDKIKKSYAPIDVDKTIESDRILKYSFNKTKIDDLCFGGCKVKWGWDYGKEEAIGVTEDAIVGTDFMAQYLTEYGVEYNENEIQEFKESGKYQLEVEAPYINNEATAEKFRDFLFQFYKNTHLTLKLTLALQDGIELEVGDIVAFDKDIGGLKPYGKSIANILGADGFSGYIQIDQQIFPYFLITSVSKSLSKVDIEVMQMHNLTGIPIIYGCMLDTYLNHNPNATVHDQSMCGDEIVVGCMNQNASTYDPDANEHDESMCVYSPDIPIADIQMTVESEGIQGITYFYIDVGYNLHLSSSGSYDPDQIPDPPTPVNANGISNVEWNVGDVDFDGDGILQQLADLVAGVNELAITDLIIPITSEYFYEGQQLVFTLVVTDGMGNQSEIVHTQVITISAPVDQGDLGDINMDGSVNVIDVVALVSHILGNTTLEGEALLRADANEDGGIDVLDIVAIINMILGGEEN